MAFIDCVEWSPSSNDIFAYKYPESNLSTYTQLVVRETQEAVLFSKGQILGKFGPGKHTLSTENLPLLRKLYGIPFGGKNPFLAEVWFVNKTAPLTIDWRTSTMRIMDHEYNQMIPIYAAGRYGLKVKDAERFLVRLVGTLTSFTSRELTDHFMGELISRTKSIITSFMSANNSGINDISTHLDDLSRFIGQPMQEFWEGYGFALEGFFVTEIDVDQSTAEGKKIAEALADRSAQNIAGYTWQQKQSFDVANNAVGNGGGMSGILAAAMLGGGFGGNGGFGSALMQPNYTQGMPQGGQNMAYNQGMPQGGMQNVQREVFCAKCGKKHSVTVPFCPNCGKKYNACPACGSDNFEDAKRCVKCGTMLQVQQDLGNVCPRCGMPVTPGTKFCSGCGNKL